MVVDFHTHADTADRDVVKAFVRECERLGTRACLIPFGDRCDHPSCSNDQTLATAKEYGEALIPFAFVDLWDRVDEGCVAAFRERGFRGLKCITPYHAYDHDLYMPIYEKAGELKMPILFHTGNLRPGRADAVHRRPMLANMHPLTIDRIGRSFPELKVVMAHLGTSFARREAAEMVKLHPNVYFDLAGTGNFRGVSAEELAGLIRWSYYEPLTAASMLASAHFQWRHAAVAEGTTTTRGHQEVDPTFRYFDKMILGSDAYLSTPQLLGEAQRHYQALTERIGLPAPIVEKIMGGTAAEWLGLA